MRLFGKPWHRGLPTLPLVLLLAFVALAAGLGMRDPSPPDEPRFVLAAKTMVESGDWLLPRRGTELYAHKPPMFMWLQALSYTVVRDWRVAFLLPSLLAGLGTLWLTWDLALRMWGRRAAVHSSLALLVTLQFGLQAKRGQIDMVLVFLTTLALWALLRHLLLHRDAKLAFLGGLASGVGTVTKGVGFLPLLVFAAWRTLPARRRAPLGGGQESASSGFGLAMLGFVLGALAWLLPVLWEYWHAGDPAVRAYVGEILFRQTGQRYVDPWHHHQPAWYFLQVIATLWLPGALLLPWLVPAWVRRLRRIDPRYWLLLGWALLVLVFFSLSPGKREVYILPALPALCVAAGPLLVGLLRRRSVRRVLLGYLLVLAMLIAAIGAIGLVDASGLATRLAVERGMEGAAVRVLCVSLLGIGLGGLAVAAFTRRRYAPTGVVIWTVLLWTGIGLGVFPALDPSSSGRALMETVAQRLPVDAELGLVAWSEQMMLQADRPTADFGFERPWHVQWQAAAQWADQVPQRRWLLFPEQAISPCIERPGTISVGRSNRRDWLLAPAAHLRPGCVTPAWE